MTPSVFTPAGVEQGVLPGIDLSARQPLLTGFLNGHQNSNGSPEALSMPKGSVCATVPWLTMLRDAGLSVEERFRTGRGGAPVTREFAVKGLGPHDVSFLVGTS